MYAIRSNTTESLLPKLRQFFKKKQIKVTELWPFFSGLLTLLQYFLSACFGLLKYFYGSVSILQSSSWQNMDCSIKLTSFTQTAAMFKPSAEAYNCDMLFFLSELLVSYWFWVKKQVQLQHFVSRIMSGLSNTCYKTQNISMCTFHSDLMRKFLKNK